MHEIGHALGMSHPGNYNAEEGVTLTYEANAEYYQDSLQYTIMSYFASSSTGRGPDLASRRRRWRTTSPRSRASTAPT